jgi:hypothetical protein
MKSDRSQIAGLEAYIDQVREQMEVILSEIDPTAEITPGWTVKEVLGHITAWELVINRALVAYQKGNPPYFMDEQDFDLFNQEAVDYRSSWTLEEVIQEWKEVRATLKKTIKKLKSTDLEAELVTPWGSERTVTELIEILGEHESEHLEDLDRAAG